VRLVSLFSGCGGMDYGFIQAGYEIVFANDFDSDAQRVYNLNFGAHIDCRDIRDVTTSEIPDCEILTAGFPCQPFSNAGNRKGVADERGNLYKECFRIVENKKPMVVVFENVRGFLSTKDENGNKLVDTIEDIFESLNYTVSYKLVICSDYQVPQNRYRVIMVAIRKDLGKKFVFPELVPKDGLEVGNIIDLPNDISGQVDWQLSPQAKMLIEYIPEGGSWKDIPYEVLPERFKKIRDNMKKYRSPNFYRRFARTEINGTITASAQPENCGILHPLENRRYTVREIARFQSFPDSFEFIFDSVKDIVGMYKVVGNAVPPRLAETFGNAIKQQVFL